MLRLTPLLNGSLEEVDMTGGDCRHLRGDWPPFSLAAKSFREVKSSFTPASALLVEVLIP